MRNQTAPSASTTRQPSWRPGSGVILNGPFEYWDAQAGLYFSWAKVKWPGTSYLNDRQCTFACAIYEFLGRRDIAGFTYSEPVYHYSAALWTAGGATPYGNPTTDSISQAGLTMTYDDMASGVFSDCNCRNVTAFNYIYPVNWWDWYQTYFTYGHTWKGTTITGVNVGCESLGLNWSSTSNHWQRAGVSPLW